MNLDLIVFESDPDRTELLTLRIFRELVALGIPDVGAPIAVVPIGLLRINFKIITYPPMVKTVARYAEQNGLKFSKAYGIVQTKLFDVLPDAESWCELGLFLNDINLIGRWLNWGLNWGALDKVDINAYIKNNERANKLLYNAEIEDTLLNLSNLNNVKSK